MFLKGWLQVTEIGKRFFRLAKPLAKRIFDPGSALLQTYKNKGLFRNGLKTNTVKPPISSLNHSRAPGFLKCFRSPGKKSTVLHLK